MQRENLLGLFVRLISGDDLPILDAPQFDPSDPRKSLIVLEMGRRKRGQSRPDGRRSAKVTLADRGLTHSDETRRAPRWDHIWGGFLFSRVDARQERPNGLPWFQCVGASLLSFIDKKTFWAALDCEPVRNFLDGRKSSFMDLKYMQDGWVFHQIHEVRGLKILEVGGGYSRLLPMLSAANEIWNADELLGDGGGPKSAPKIDGMKLVRKRLGDFSDDLPTGYFDLVFSVSVIEHVPNEALDAFWKDHRRVLKNGGRGVHAIDLYVGDTANSYNEERVGLYRDLPVKHGMRFRDPPSINSPVIFRSNLASNPDYAMWRWNTIAPGLKKTREHLQSVSIAMLLDG